MIASRRVARCRQLLRQANWQHPKIMQGNINQTELAIANAPTTAVPFSFGIIGDTDPGLSKDQPMASEAFVEQLMQQLGESRFLLHTGDVAYPIGSYESYLNGFLRPYRALLSSLPQHFTYRSDAVVFKQPLLPVPGNHDCADLPIAARWRHSLLRFLSDRLRQLDIDIGCYGGYGGEAYSQTFLDNLHRLSEEQLMTHLATHYSANSSPSASTATAPGRSPSYCLNYRSGEFTRLPNCYYHFRYGGIDFFALDSNTWNGPPEIAEFDHEQLSWLEQGLIASWQTPGTYGRIVYLHHSPYTTEETRWHRSETLWVRRHLRSVLDRVAARLNQTVLEEQSVSEIFSNNSRPPLVDLIISGHAHCLEHIHTTNTGHADAYLDWIVCGGSGASLRRRRSDSSADILERLAIQTGIPHRRYTSVVAQSQCYVGASGSQPQGRSFIRVDVTPEERQKFVVRPFVVTQSSQGWQTHALAPLDIGAARRHCALPICSR